MAEKLAESSGLDEDERFRIAWRTRGSRERGAATQRIYPSKTMTVSMENNGTSLVFKIATGQGRRSGHAARSAGA